MFKNRVCFLIIVLVLFIRCESEGPRLLKNPYENVDWEEVNQYVMNLHCQSILSDGRSEPADLIYSYVDAGYDILAITDHDNYSKQRKNERYIEPTHKTTWPWTRWIDERPSQFWKTNGIETSAFYSELGENGMLAIRGNELTSHPHMLSAFSDCGFEHRNQTDTQRIECVQEDGGLSFWLHPSDYTPGGRWENIPVAKRFDRLTHYDYF